MDDSTLKSTVFDLFLIYPLTCIRNTSTMGTPRMLISSVNKLFLEIRKILSEKNPEIGRIEPEYSEMRPGDVPHSMADISLAKSFLGYRPEKTIEEGLLATVNSFLV